MVKVLLEYRIHFVMFEVVQCCEVYSVTMDHAQDQAAYISCYFPAQSCKVNSNMP